MVKTYGENFGLATKSHGGKSSMMVNHTV